jgi:hypothetical protein
MKKSVYVITQDAANLGMALAYLEGQGDEVSTEDITATMEKFKEYSADMPTKVLCLYFAEDRLKAEIATLKGEVEIMQNHIRAAQRSIDRVKDMRIALFSANIKLVGDTGRKVKLPDKSSAWLVQQECHPKAVVAKKHEHLLPDSVKVEDTVMRVDKDLLLEWSETGEPVYDDKGEPVVTIEWVDPTHTRRK